LFSRLRKLMRVEVAVRSSAGWWEEDTCIQFCRVDVIEFWQSCMTKMTKSTLKSHSCGSQKLTSTPKPNLLYRRSYPTSEHHWEQCSDLGYKRFHFSANLQSILLLKGPICHIGHDELHRGFGAVWAAVIKRVFRIAWLLLSADPPSPISLFQLLPTYLVMPQAPKPVCLPQ
jgi:hypothetical protein